MQRKRKTHTDDEPQPKKMAVCPSLPCAARQADLKAVENLLAGSSKKSLELALFQAASKGHVKIFEKIYEHYLKVEKPSHIDALIHANISLLHISCGTKQIEITSMLVERYDSDVNGVLEKDGLTPMHICASFGSPMCLRYILQRGANHYQYTSESMMNALHFAVNNGRMKCAEILVLHDRKLLNTVSPKNLRTPLHFALLNEKIAIFEWLVEQGAQDKPDINGQSSLFCLPARECNLSFPFRKYFSYSDRHKWFSSTVVNYNKAILNLKFIRGKEFQCLKSLAKVLVNSLVDSPSPFKRVPHLDFTFADELGRGSGVNRECFAQLDECIKQMDILERTPTNAMYFKKIFTRSDEPSIEDKAKLFDVSLLGTLFALGFIKGHAFSLPLPKFLFKLATGVRVSPEDIKDIDEELYHNKVEYLRSCTEEELIELELTFSEEETHPSGDVHEIPLRENGCSESVNKTNLEEYLRLSIAHHLMWGRKPEIYAFVSAFNLFAPRKLLSSIFDYQEIFDAVVQPVATTDINTFKKLTSHDGLDRVDDIAVVDWFWDAVEEMTPDNRGHLLSFFTGSNKLPLQMLHATEKPLKIFHDVNLTHKHYPCSRTCLNTLILPPIETKEDLQRKLHAITEAQSTRKLTFGFV